MHRTLKRLAVTSVMAAGLPLCLLAGTAQAATPDANHLGCTTGFSGPNGWATCVGSGDWALSLYCNFPSPSPITNSEIVQSGGSVTSRASCWFGASVQRVAVIQY